MASAISTIITLLYPKHTVCISCGALHVDDPRWDLCRACADALEPYAPPFCPRCGCSGWKMLCPDCHTKRPDALDGRYAAFPYQKTASNLVRALKYHNVFMAAEALADGMMAVMPEETPDALVPVPLHPRKLRQRGFNQAEALCHALSRRSGLPIWDALRRTRNTQTQTKLSNEQRRQNVAGAFALTLPVGGTSLLLVDDVMTTGATAGACARVLKADGAQWVGLLTAARAEMQA